LGDPETWDWLVTPPSAPTISISSPTNTQVLAGGSNIQIDTSLVAPSPVVVVEFFNGTNLIGTANTAPFSFTWLNVPDGIYPLTARVTDVLGYQITSATVQIVVDSTKPVPYAVGSLRGSGIGVYFTDLSGLETITATTPGNYTVNGGAVTVTSAVLEPDNLAVMLSLSAPISGPFTVQIANVADRGYGPNVMNPVTLESTVVNWPLLNRDVGTINTTNSALFTDPIMPGFAQAIGLDGYYVRAGGHDIWDAADGMHFVYLPVAGDFDVAVRVQALRRPNEWSKAGLMVREDLDGNSRNHMIAATPTNGQNLITMQWRPTKGATCASIVDAIRPRPSPIPNAWLRVARTADQYTFYWGTNGTFWTAITNVTLNYSTVYLGVATTSHDNGTNVANVTSAYYRDLTGVPMISGSTAGSNLVICWPPSLIGARLEGQVNPITIGLGANWTTVPNSATTNRVFVPILPGQIAGFYRLAYP
jgi:regulation of enolase protein 1 (concanavalin A-like superfamily)